MADDTSNHDLTEDELFAEPWLDRQQQAEFLTELGLPINARTLANLHAKEEGPRVLYWSGRPKSRPSWLREWAAERLLSTPRRTRAAA